MAPKKKTKAAPPAAAAAARETTIDNLSDDLLCRVFLMLSQRHRVRPVAQTCKRWKTLTVRPNMWHRMELSCELHNVEPAVAIPTLTSLQRRCSATRDLQIKVSGVAISVTSPALRVRKLLPLESDIALMGAQVANRGQEEKLSDNVVQTVLVAVAPSQSLSKLTIELGDNTSVSSEALVSARAEHCIQGMDPSNP